MINDLNKNQISPLPLVPQPKSRISTKVLVIVSLFVAAAGLTYVALANQKFRDSQLVKNLIPFKENLTIQDCTSRSFSDSQECFLQFGQERKNVKLCDQILYASGKAKCQIGVAVGKRDKGLCLHTFNADDSSNRDSCLEQVAIALADPSVCQDATQNFRQSCIFNVATKSKLPDACQTIKDSNAAGNCLATVAKALGEANLCNQLKAGSLQESCYYNIAIDKSEPTICGYLPESGNIYSKGSCYSDIADKTNNGEICKQITDPLFHDDCLTKLSVNSKNPELCTFIKNPDLELGCIKTAAYKLGDISICNEALKVLGSGLVDDCISNYAASKKDQSLCDKIQDVSIEEGCYRFFVYYIVSETFTEFTDCSSLKDPQDKYDCYYLKVTSHNDPNLCEAMPKDGWKDACYGALVKTQNQSQLCLKIRDTKTKDLCIQNWALDSGDKTNCVLITDVGIKNGCIYGSRPASATNLANSFCPITSNKPWLSFEGLNSGTITAAPGDSVAYDAKIINNMDCIVSLGSMSSGISSTAQQSSPNVIASYTDLPLSISPHQSISGTVFTVKIPQDSPPAYYDGNVKINATDGYNHLPVVLDFNFKIDVK